MWARDSGGVVILSPLGVDVGAWVASGCSETIVAFLSSPVSG
jgi:hypothetical protein